MRVFIFDNGLTDKSGHHYNLNLKLFKQLQLKNIDVRILGPKKVVNTPDQPFRIEPFFAYTIYDRPFKDKLSKPLDNFLFLNHQYLKDLKRIKSQNLKPDDVIIIHTATQNMLLGLAHWLSEFPEDEKPYVYILLPFSHPVNKQGAHTTLAMFYSHALKILKNNKKTFIASTSEELAKVYSDISDGTKVHKIPMPVEYNDALNLSSQKKKGKIRLTYLGHSRRQKSLLILPEIVQEITALDIAEKLDIFIQLTPADKMKKEHRRLKKLGDKITIYPDVLEEEDFYDQLNKTDIMFMPYSPKSYKYESSGLFSESAGLGKVMVLPNNTWMASEWARFGGGGSSFDEAEPENIANAVREAVINFEKLRKQSQETSKKFREYHNIENFVNIVFDHMGLKP